VNDSEFERGKTQTENMVISSDYSYLSEMKECIKKFKIMSGIQLCNFCFECVSISSGFNYLKENHLGMRAV
jgi:hypothetical protein